jgi:hypothetical protein
LREITNILETKAIFHDTEEHRFILEKTWDREKPAIAIIMLYPCTNDGIQTDLTTMLTINNSAKQGYGSVIIWNMFSKINCDVRTEEEPNLPENDAHIVQGASTVDRIILAYGKGGESNKKVLKRQYEILRLLEPFKEKLVVIADAVGNKGYNPLTPSIRNNWKLVPFDFPTLVQESEDKKEDKRVKKRTKKHVPDDREQESTQDGNKEEQENKFAAQ